MRTLVLTLALLGGCGAAPGDTAVAPPVDASLAERSVTDRLDTLEAQTAQLTKQLAAAQATIAALEKQVAVQGGDLKLHDQAIFEVDPKTGARVSKIDALTIKQKVTENALGTVEAAVSGILAAEFDVKTAPGETPIQAAKDPAKMTLKFKPEITRKVVALESVASDNAIHVANLGAQQSQLAERVVQTGDTTAVLADYALALAGGDLGTDAGPSGTTDEIVAALFESDPETGAETPRVDGAGVALALRLRKRPEILYQAWDDVLDEHLSDIVSNPLHTAQDAEVNPLFGLGEHLSRLDTAVVDQGADLDALDAELDRAVADALILNPFLVEAATDTLRGELDRLATSTAHFIDDWQGEVAYLKVEDELLWTESHDQRARLDGLAGDVSDLRATDEFLNGQVMYLAARIAGVEGSLKEVKELADILKSDYGIRLAAVEGGLVKLDGALAAETKARFVADGEIGITVKRTDDRVGALAAELDALWAETIAADADLQKQLDALSGETCLVGDLADALAVGDRVVVDEALAAHKGGNYCGTTDHL